MSCEKCILSVEQIDLVFRALASRQRREILRLLMECRTDGCGTEESLYCAPEAIGSTGDRAGEVCACKLSARLGLAPSTISHHMAILQKAGLVRGRKDGTWVHYMLEDDVIRCVAEELLQLCGQCCAGDTR